MTGLVVLEKSLSTSPILTQCLGNKKDKYILSVLTEVKKTIGDDKKDLSVCTPDSIIACIKQACDLQLEIDGRQHCHLVKYGKTASLQIGYRGFIYAIKRFYPDVNIDVKLVYEGDNFLLKKEGDLTTYSLEIGNPFAVNRNLVGGFCYISYTVGGRLVSFCETMSIVEINKIKSCAKQDFIWKQWFEEKAKVAIIKRACKIHFSGINQEIADVIEYDNKEYDLSKSDVIIEAQEKITCEQGLEIEKLAKKKGKDIKTICAALKLNSIIDLPSDKFQTIINKLNLSPDIKEEVIDANN